MMVKSTFSTCNAQTSMPWPIADAICQGPILPNLPIRAKLDLNKLIIWRMSVKHISVSAHRSSGGVTLYELDKIMIWNGDQDGPISDNKTGTGDSDFLNGLLLDDTIKGLGGDDFIWGDSGNDWLEGGANNDTLDGGDDQDHIFGGDGDDVLWGGDGLDTIRGGKHTDFINGGAYHDFLYGDSGDDTLVGEDGIDFLTGGEGNDNLSGGKRDDFLYGDEELETPTDDPLNSKDILIGGDGDDELYGGAGVDYLDGGKNDDLGYGGSGKDQLWGWQGSDRLHGDGDDDQIFGHGFFNSGNAIPEDWAKDFLFGDAGNDFLTGCGGDDVLRGGDNDDELYGNYFPNNLLDPLLAGDFGDDKLFGEAGNDTLFGDLGNDALNGGADVDTADYSLYTVALRIDLGDTIVQQIRPGEFDLLVNIENFKSGSGNDTITGSKVANVLEGAGGNDVLASGGAAAGRDVLIGGIGDDVMYGGNGEDSFQGGAGTDLVSYKRSDAAVEVSLAILGAQDTKGTGIDSILSTENLEGSAFDDTLSGDGKANEISGLNGGDRIFGDGGRDRLIGGSGKDVFLYSDPSESRQGASDIISDFKSGVDKIDLSLIDANTKTAVDDDFDFVGNGNLGLSRLTYDFGVLSGDVNGDGAADFAIVLIGRPAITIDDLIL